MSGKAWFVAALLIAFSPGWPCAQEGEGERSGDPPREISIEQVVTAYREGDYGRVIELTEGVEMTRDLRTARASAFQRRGEKRFFDADIEGSIADFDAFLDMVPERDPHHWQRGLSYYYADKYQKGKEQFERHQTVNTQDVENAVWHFLCAVRAPGGDFKEAQSNLIPIEHDRRIPMKEVHDLFGGRGSVEEVLAASTGNGEGGDLSEADRNHLCYAHLYLALWFEANGEDEAMAHHIRLAAGRYRMDHYMGKVAQVHAKLRGIEINGPTGE